MSALPRTTLASRLQVPREFDGLTGRTEEERREIQSRIDRVSALKAKLGGRVLTPFEIALALGADRRSPKRLCRKCGAKLPGTPEYFPVSSGDILRHSCRLCWRRYQLRKDKERRKSPEVKRSAAERCRIYRQQRKAAGIPRPPSTPLSRLKGNRRQARLMLARAATDEARERIKARIANLTHEIDRLAAKGGGA